MSCDDDFYDDGLEDVCDHDEYEIDILTSRAECSCCQHTWHLSKKQMDAEFERLAQYDEWQAREDRRESIRRFFAPITNLMAHARRLLGRPSATDDLPF